ncbi:MAG: TetR/AcrR family transcriptional regulator [Candidatus Margulisbacteria bacterium]|nr:TetR/AcrR family transcriptional regulator [Candidatus Margulisiibacteriota bacterium]
MPKIVNKQEKRSRLVQAAIPVFAKYTFREAKMNDVAISADVGKGTLYEYFESKDELFLEIFKMWFSTLEAQIHDVVNAIDDPGKQLITFYEQYFATIEKYSDTYYIYFDFWTELVRNPKISSQEIKDVYQSLRSLVAGILEDGVSLGIFKKLDPQVKSIQLLSIVDGLLLQWLMDRESFSLKEVGIDSVNVFLESLML